ncbi:MAG: glutamate-1-semialdehyde 2,1-aminomutase [Deltaproteobacteria bacterium]
MRRARSEKDFRQAKKTLVGGVNSPVRAFRAVGGTPVFVKSGRGSRITDVDGNTYVDYVMSWGALILGHAFAPVVQAVKAAAGCGSSFGAPTERETELAGLIIEAFPSMQKARLVNSGTEAAMSAIRLARGCTGRSRIIKFEGCYHGHSDSLLIKAGSGAATFGVPDSAGIPASLARETIVLPYNDIGAVERCFASQGGRIACVIVEPVAANMGVVVPPKEFLAALRRLTRAHGALLIFDEVITGFRLGLGGAQSLYGIDPDLTCLGKIIGGGMPLAAFGGKSRYMDRLAPLGDVYQAGTLSGNPCAVAAGIAALRELRRRDYRSLDLKTASLCGELAGIMVNKGIPFRLNCAGSLFTIFFSGKDVTDFSSAKKADTRLYASYFRRMLEQGVNLPPSQFEANFVSFAHTRADLDRTVAAFSKAIRGL